MIDQNLGIVPVYKEVYDREDPRKNSIVLCRKATETHIENVNAVGKVLIDVIVSRLANHDCTKTEDIERYYKALSQNFKGTISKGWLDYHFSVERHHIDSEVPEEVDFIDIIEMIIDGAVAATGRGDKSSYNYRKLSNKVLQEAFKNTQDLILAMIKDVDSL